MMELREYQEKLAQMGAEKLSDYGIVYFAVEMRVGKTLIAMRTCELRGHGKILFVSKKKALTSICNDYENMKFRFFIDIINYEQLKNYTENQYDAVIVDEAHGTGAYPKPSERTKFLTKIMSNNPKSDLILLSGTPSPESYSQLYHQFAISPRNPFGYRNFYTFAKEFVNVKEVVRNGLRFREYKDCRREHLMPVLEKYFIRFTQSQAGFEMAEVKEMIIKLPASENVTKFVKLLMKHKYYKFADGSEVVCDSAVKLQGKIHQAFSGTIKTEGGDFKIIDTTKAKYIKNAYSGLKIAVFYKYIAEGEVLKQFFPNFTDNPEEFNLSKDKIFISQIQSGSMGVNLSSADVLIFYNIDFSAVQYWQARARLQDLMRIKQPLVHWLMIENGIESKIYERVLQKKNYTISYFKRDFSYEK